MKKLLQVAALSSFVLFSTGCATIMSKSEYLVNIQSAPKGASYVIKNRAGEEVWHGTTPDTVTLKAGAGYFKGERYQITFTLPKNGKNPAVSKTVELDSKLDGWYLGGNLIFGGLLGYLVIDPLTGAMYKLPESVRVNLDSNDQALNIISLDSLTAEQKTKLQPINL